MTTSLFDKIQSQMITALKTKDKLTLDTLRFLISAIKNAQIDKQSPLTDQEIITLIRQQIKKQQEEIDYFEKANRHQEVQKQRQKIAILQKFLPPPLTDDQVKQKILQTVSPQTIQTTPFGQLMGQLIKSFQGQVPNQQIARVLKTLKNSYDPQTN